MAEYDRIIEEMLKRNFSSVYTSKSEKFNILYNDLLKTICSVEDIDDNNVRFCIANPLLKGKYCIDNIKVIDLLTIVYTLKTLMEARKKELKEKYFNSIDISFLPLLSSKEESSIRADKSFSDFYDLDKDVAKKVYDNFPRMRVKYLIYEGDCIYSKMQNKLRSRLMSMPLEIKRLAGYELNVPLIDENIKFEKLVSNNMYITSNSDISEYREYTDDESKVYSNFLKSSYR